MVTIRATRKLLRRLKVSPETDPPPSPGRLGDWYANLFVLRRAQLVLCVSERTLLPVIVPAKDIAAFPRRLVDALERVLRGIGVSEAHIIRELAHMREWHFGKTASRAVIGSMTDFVTMLEFSDRPPAALLDAAPFLAETPCGPLGMKSPRRATLSTLS